jgi:hypothetical protein
MNNNLPSSFLEVKGSRPVRAANVTDDVLPSCKIK